MPPPGGFEAVKYKRNLPFRGPSGVVILGAVTAVCVYGFYRVGLGNLERRYVEVCVESWDFCVPIVVGRGQVDVKRGQSQARTSGNVALFGFVTGSDDMICAYH